MSTTTTTAPVAVRDPAHTGLDGAPERDRVDLASIRVVHTRHWFRWALSAILIFAIAQFVWSLFTNENYEWNVFATYFFSEPVLAGIGYTLSLSAISASVGFILGTVLALGRLSKSPLLNAISWSYIWFFRSVPLVVQIIVWYNLGYLYPTLGLGTPFTTDFWIVEFPTVQLISAVAAAILGLGLHQAAYSAEIIRGGLIAVDQGQQEAAAALGIPAHKRLFRIILPQAMRSIVPNATNEVIGLVKGASVVFVIAIPELFYAVQVIYNRNSRVIPLLLVAVVWYTIITTILSIAQYYIERYYARGSVRTLPPTPLQRARHWVAVQWNRLGDGAPAPPPLHGAEVAPTLGVTQQGSRNDAKFGGNA
ncbi:L-cystine transport system permease protein YecS [Microbacterium oxydans]|uniref:Inner membrane amino-acid ABC transporter permease protein YecS n=1 Tax=Microbacterium oxydans TaxID=82380 RepID=A0A0F0LC38_9MICO|nr:amino acid ABC transporter permease [Microbacterium oxydans]KJL29840.1 Inner membrane amino-acid ABC transporter permease protein YecS [Microbacterium oxydans]CAH0150182.1 L-cystine transport system permease protein YecS [Microbacterium oxydans]